MKVSTRFVLSEVSTIDKMHAEAKKRLDDIGADVDWDINIIIDTALDGSQRAEVQAFWVEKVQPYGETVDPTPKHKVVVSPTATAKAGPKTAKIAKQWEKGKK